jgi:hypothetical protein
MANHCLIDDASLENLPRYEKRRPPERCSFNTPVRRALSRSRRRRGSTAASPTSGFNRRYISKPFRAVD